MMAGESSSHPVLFLHNEVQRKRNKLITIGVEKTEALLRDEIDGEPTCHPDYLSAETGLAQTVSLLEEHIASALNDSVHDPSTDLRWIGGKLISRRAEHPELYDDPLRYSNGLHVID